MTPEQDTARRTPVTLTTERLRLRPYVPGDAEALQAACSDPLIARWTNVPTPYPLDVAQHFIDTVAAGGWAAGTDAVLAVVDRADDALLASVGLHFSRGRDEAEGEIGYWCAPGARGRGVVPEAVAAVCDWAFDRCGLVRISWLAEVGNEGSWRAAEKAGFRREGTLRSYLSHRDRRVDAWIGALLAHDRVLDSST